jgi:hypothetical protein
MGNLDINTKRITFICVIGTTSVLQDKSKDRRIFIKYGRQQTHLFNFPQILNRFNLNED